MSDVITKLDNPDYHIAHRNKVEVLVDDAYVEVQDIEEFKQSASNEIETIYIYGEEGYSKSVKTGHKESYSIIAIKNTDCPAQQEIIKASKSNGSGAARQFRITEPGQTQEFIGVIDLTSSGNSGAAIDLLKLEGTIHVSGKPVVTPKGFASRLRMEEDE